MLGREHNEVTKSGSDVPAFRPIHKSVNRWGSRERLTIPLLKHTAALLETVPEP